MTTLHPGIRTSEQWEAAIERNRQMALLHGLDGAIQITRGRFFWPLEPDHPGNDIDIEHIAHNLATESRWGGNMYGVDGFTPISFSVAQHSVHVSDIVNLNRRKLVPKWDWDNDASPAPAGLGHDKPEAYAIRDMVRPVKVKLDGYKEIENGLADRIYRDFGIPTSMGINEAVRRADNLMIFLERDKLLGKPVVPYSNEFDHPRFTIDDVVPDFYVWSPKEAKERFLLRWEQLQADPNHIPLEYRGRGYTL